MPKNKNHDVKLYGRSTTEESLLFEGKIRDLSKFRARMYNIKKRTHAIIGRKKELYNAVKYIRTNNVFNLYGESGCGKTFLAKEICYFLYMRNFYRDGIFYYDVEEVKNLEKIKALFHESDLNSAIEEVIKIIFKIRLRKIGIRRKKGKY